MKKSKLEQEKIKRYHFVIVGFGEFKNIIRKFDENLKFYRLENQGKTKAREIIYDVPNNMLSDSGIVLSKLYEDGKVMFNVRKLSTLPGQLKRPSKKFILGELEVDEEPKDFSLSIASAIENSFNSTFTVDLDAFVKQTVAKIEITVDAVKYKIISGTGYRASILFENALYRDIKTNKKVSQQGVTLQLPLGEENEKCNQELLNVIDKKIEELAPSNLSRFEIAQRLLYPKVDEQPDIEPASDEE